MRKGRAPDVDGSVGKWSDDGDSGVRYVIEERKSTPKSTYPTGQPIHAEHCRKGRKVESMEWNKGAPKQGAGGDQ